MPFYLELVELVVVGKHNMAIEEVNQLDETPLHELILELPEFCLLLNRPRYLLKMLCSLTWSLE